MNSPFRVYIGWDSREPRPTTSRKFSLMRRASIPVEVHADQGR